MSGMIKTKCVDTPSDPAKDGFRVLATRFRGRGLPKSRYHAWVPSLGPSEKLLGDIQAGRIHWSEFERRYRKELLETAPIDRRNRTIKNHGQKFTLRLLQGLSKQMPVTLLCHCAENESHCHRHILAKIIARI
jgi:uncharacterized protein YeaO (DUF488 family)